MTTEEIDKYKKGFNSGYVMALENPELLKSLLKSKPSSENVYFEGLKDGSRQHEKEIERAKIREQIITMNQPKEKDQSEKEK